MPVQHIFLAILVAVIWGVNFLFVKIGLEEISPLLLCALRFSLASIPAIFFIKPPAIPFRIVAFYGLFMFALQFSLLFIGMNAGMTSGMASLIMQVQVFFSMFFAAILIDERPGAWQVTGALISFIGIGLVSLHFDSNVSLIGFLFILAAAATWGFGNLITKKSNNVNVIALIVWGSFVAVIPTLLLSLFIEGPGAIATSYHQLTWKGTSALLYIVFVSTWIGYGLWNWLLSRHPVSMVVPFTLLVPIVGVISSVVFFGEPLQQWKIMSGLLVISGLCISIFGERLFTTRVEQEAF